MMTEIEVTSNTEKNKKDRKPSNPSDMQAHHQKVFQNHPNIIAIVTDSHRVNLLTPKEMRIKVATFRIKLIRKKISNLSLSIISRRRKIIRNRRIKIISKRHNLRRVVSMERRCIEIIRIDFIPNPNLEL